MPEVATPNQGEREFETGTDETFKNANATGSEAHNENQRVTYANIKRTYDVYQDLDIQAARQSLIEQTRLNQIASQALQNAVETANMVGKQAIRHADVAADALWTDELNPVTRGAGSNITAGSVPANRAIDVSAAGVGVDAQAVAAAVAKQVDATITPVLATLQQIVQALTTATTAIRQGFGANAILFQSGHAQQGLDERPRQSDRVLLAREGLSARAVPLGNRDVRL